MTDTIGGWNILSIETIHARVEAFCVAQGRTMPFLGDDVGTKHAKA